MSAGNIAIRLERQLVLDRDVVSGFDSTHECRWRLHAVVGHLNGLATTKGDVTGTIYFAGCAQANRLRFAGDRQLAGGLHLGFLHAGLVQDERDVWIFICF